MKFKCQLCGDRAVIHITEIDADTDASQVHFCYRHAQEYLRQQEESGASSAAAPGEKSAAETISNAKCPICGISFEEFRQVGRLGCPNDYEVFREELKPLLENIHGSLRHLGKVPRRLPADTRKQAELIKLRQEIQQAIAVEDYEKAAKLRDQIDLMEKGVERTGC